MTMRGLLCLDSRTASRFAVLLRGANTTTGRSPPLIAIHSSSCRWNRNKSQHGNLLVFSNRRVESRHDGDISVSHPLLCHACALSLGTALTLLAFQQMLPHQEMLQVLQLFSINTKLLLLPTLKDSSGRPKCRLESLLLARRFVLMPVSLFLPRPRQVFFGKTFGTAATTSQQRSRRWNVAC